MNYYDRRISSRVPAVVRECSAPQDLPVHMISRHNRLVFSGSCISILKISLNPTALTPTKSSKSRCKSQLISLKWYKITSDSLRGIIWK